MDLQFTDYNDAELQVRGYHEDRWCDISEVLAAMPLHLKASDQEGKQGSAIFDPVGTNEHIKNGLSSKGWRNNIPIPKKFDFLGTDVDFGKDGTIVEVQFSNYPFLLNNTVRSELFYKSKLPLAGRPTELTVIITKAHMFPASNSTLYYEQAQRQLDELAQYRVFDVPVRLVGLFAAVGEQCRAIYTQYENPRYSRTVVERNQVDCRMARGKTSRSRCIPRISAA